MKDVNEIFSAMLSLFQEKTGMDMSQSSDLAVRLYAAAAQMESLYGYCRWALRQSFPQTATGENLDKHAAMRLLSRKAGEKARGMVTFYLSQPAQEEVVIPAGTVLTTASLVRFRTTEAGVIGVGESAAEVPCEAESVGSHGNVAAGTVTKMPQIPVSVVRCENAAPFTGGADAETDEALRVRILESYKRLPNGANAAFYEGLALQQHGVRAVKVLPRRRGVGTVDVVIAGDDGIPSAALVQELKERMDEYRELAVDVLVTAPDAIPVSLHLTVWPRDGVSGEEAVQAAEEALRGFFDGSLLGKSVYLTELGSRVYATGKVKNYTITAPGENILCGEMELPILSELVVTEGV